MEISSDKHIRALNLRHVAKRCDLQEVKYDIKEFKDFLKKHKIKIKGKYTNEDIRNILNELHPNYTYPCSKIRFVFLLSMLTNDNSDFCRENCPHRKDQNLDCKGIELLN